MDGIFFMKKYFVFKNLICVFLISFFVFGLFSKPTIASAQNIKVVVDGKQISFTDAKPFIDSNYRTQVPMRALGEALGCNVSYIPSSYKYDEEYGDYYTSPEIVLQKKTNSGLIIEANYSADNTGPSSLYIEDIWMGGIYLDTYIVTINNRAYLPARFVAENFGYKITWDSQSNSVIINTNPDDILFTHTNSTVVKEDLYGCWVKTGSKGELLHGNEITFTEDTYSSCGVYQEYFDYDGDFTNLPHFIVRNYPYDNHGIYKIESIDKNIVNFTTNVWDMPIEWDGLDEINDDCTFVLLDKNTALLINHAPYSDIIYNHILKRYEYSEDINYKEWITELDLQQISGNYKLCFYKLPENNGEWIYRFGESNSFSSNDVYVIWDMPESFEDSNNKVKKYNGIRFKCVDGKWYFNQDDLIKVGILNDDGTYNYNFKDNQTRPSDVDKLPIYTKDWIGESELSSTYGYNTMWLGEIILISKTDWVTNTTYEYEITGSPKSSFDKNRIYTGSCNGISVDFKYTNEIMFYYKDLLNLKMDGLR